MGIGRRIVLLALLASALSGCVDPRIRALDKYMRFVPVILLLEDGRLYSGNAVDYLRGEGITEVSISVAGFGEGACRAREFNYLSQTRAVMQLQCTDETEALVELDLQNIHRGIARGQYSQGGQPAGQFTLTLGMKPSEASAYLPIPPGKRLTWTEDGLRLLPQ